MSFTLAIVGRPNVGKSTLFNRLVGKRLALVDDQPGVTRDLREGDARLGDLYFTVIDTAGLEDADAASLSGRMRALTERAVDAADVTLFVVDARAGVTAVDTALAEMLRKRAKRLVLAANKAEGRAAEDGLYDAYSLGLGEPVAISAEHGEGMGDLLAALRDIEEDIAAELAQQMDGQEPQTELSPDEEAEARPIQLAVVGRPNAGKSTLVNALLGEDRLLTGPEAGITRDAISVSLDWGGQAFRIFDTAGMRKKARVQEKLEKLSVADGLRAVRFAEVVLVLLDATQPFETQDLRIADLAEREGRAVVVAVNKWDLVEDKARYRAELEQMFERMLPQLRGTPLIFLSALTGKGLDRLLEGVMKSRDAWNKRISTAALNRWLAQELTAHPPPAPGGRRIKLRYMTQVKARPPTFVVMCSRPEAVPDAYHRFLVNGLRRDFGLEGTPIRINLRKGENPYEGRKEKRPTALSKHIKPRRN